MKTNADRAGKELRMSKKERIGKLGRLEKVKLILGCYFHNPLPLVITFIIGSFAIVWHVWWDLPGGSMSLKKWLILGWIAGIPLAIIFYILIDQAIDYVKDYLKLMEGRKR